MSDVSRLAAANHVIKQLPEVFSAHEQQLAAAAHAYYYNYLLMSSASRGTHFAAHSQQHRHLLSGQRRTVLYYSALQLNIPISNPYQN